MALIFKEVDWHAYHKLKCNDHDFCGAIQGCGGGEDVQSLFLAVDALMDELDTPNETVGTQVRSADVAHPCIQASAIYESSCFC